MANQLAEAALQGLRIGREEGQQANRSQQAKDWYEGWKKDNGLPKDSNALPPVDATPTWARPYLFPRADASPQSDLQIAGGVLLPGESPAGGKGGLGSMTGAQVEEWIKQNGITGAGADKIRQKHKGLQGGTDLFPLAQVTPGPAPTWPMHKWPHPTPGQGPLPNPNIPPGSGLDIASLSQEALNALKIGAKGNKSSREIRDLLKPFTQPDQFGHPTGSMRLP